MAKKPVVKATKDAVEKTASDAAKTVESKVVEAKADAKDAVKEVAETNAADLPKAKTLEEPKKKSSFASKALTAIALLFAGGAAALYGGPKVAPMLPAGMAPVAKFLSPGEASMSDQIAQIETDFDARLGALENAKAPDLSENLKTLNADIDTRFATLSDQMAAVDGKDIETRLSAVETQVTGLSATMNSLNEQLAGVEGGTNSAELAGYQSVIEGLKAEITALSTKQGAMGQRIDEVSANTDRRVEEAEIKVAEVQETAEATISDISRAKAITDITAAMESGSDFSAALASLTDGGVSVPEALSNVSGGIPTLASLKTGFSSAAHAGLKASIKADAPTGVGGKLSSFLKSQVTVRSLEPQEGSSTDAVLSRIQGALDNDDLSQALEQTAGLNDVAKSAMADWLASAQTRQSAQSALSALSAK